LPTARRTKALPVDNADSTLRIVKERQPISNPARKQALGMLSGGIDEMVEVNGIEPMTPCLQSRCSPS
jgi:hypothetical protein